MKTLDELAIEHQTDRASVFTRTYGKPHNYAAHYDKLFTPLRDQPVKFLEVGVGGGEGICMWMGYFVHEKSRFFGVDIVKDTNDFNHPGVSSWSESRDEIQALPPFHWYTFTQGDQCDPEFWKRFIAENGGDFDIICDDGLHSNIAVITTFNALWQHVKPGGFYCVEDLNVAYGGPSFFVNPDWPDHVTFLKGKIDELNQGGGIDSIYWAKEICILRKAL